MKTGKKRNKNFGMKTMDEIPSQLLSNEDYQFILELIDKIKDPKAQTDQIIKLIQLITQKIVLINKILDKD